MLHVHFDILRGFKFEGRNIHTHVECLDNTMQRLRFRDMTPAVESKITRATKQA